MVSSVNLLLSKIKTDREMTSLVSANLTNADVEGFTRKEAYDLTRNGVDGGLRSVRRGDVQRVVDNALQSQVEIQSNKLNKLDTLRSFYDKISHVIGSKGSQQTFAHQLGTFSSALNNVASNPTLDNKYSVIQQAVSLTNTLNSTGDQLIKLRTEIDIEIYQCIQQFNNNILQIEDCNKRIAQLTRDKMDATNIQDERDLCVHRLNELYKVKTYLLPDSSIAVATDGGMTSTNRLISSGEKPYLYDYEISPYIMPNQALNKIYYNSDPGLPGTGRDVTAEFTNGKIGALLNMRDEILVNFQSELDELTRAIRDDINVLHNEGATLNGTSVKTGLASLPEVVGVPNGTTGIDGQGTLRIGVTNDQGTLVDYKDILLTDGMTIDSLILSITSQNYGFSGGAAALANGDFTVQQLATGELQLSTNTPGMTISIGSVTGSPAPRLSAITTTSTGFDPARSLGFSHFFGLNNFFLTDTQIYSQNSQVGIANVIKVNPILIEDSRNLSVGTLDPADPPTQNPKMGIKAGDSIIARRLSDALSRDTHSFLQAGQQPPTLTPITDYATRLLSFVQTNINNNKHQAERQTFVYELLAETAHKRSAVDPSKEILSLFSLSTSQQITSKALNMVQQMDRDIFNEISRR